MKPDFGHWCQIRIEAPKGWDFQPVCNLYQEKAAILVHFSTLKVFKSRMQFACDLWLFFCFQVRKVRRTSLVAARRAVQSNFPMQRSAGITSVRRGTASWCTALLIFLPWTVWLWPGERPDFGAGQLWCVVLGCRVQHCYGVAVSKGWVLQSWKSQGHWCDCFRSTFQCLLLRHLRAARKHHHGQRKFS